MEKAVFKATRKDAVHPKQKHVDTLIQMTLSGASMEELLMLIQDRFSEANWVISFKALILVHVLMHEGNGPMLYDYLIHRPNALDMTRFRDRNGTKGVSEFEQSKNVRTYASYLNDKVLAYKAIRIDHVTQKSPAGSQIYLKQPTDIKFMLLEVSTVQKQLHSVLKNRFDSDTLDNETTFSAFRYCLRDMLKLFQVMNLGVMKMLKVYFEMRLEDMRRALDLYKRFVKLTDRTDEYLKIARQFEAIFGFSIPNLTHAPLSLSKALEDFLEMPEEERASTVRDMRAAAKNKPQQQQQPAAATSASASGLGAGKRPVEVALGTTKAKPDYGLKLKPELVSGSNGSGSQPRSMKSPVLQSGSNNTVAARSPGPAQPTAAAASSTAAAAAAKPAEIDFIDFFSSIDDETVTTQVPQQQQQQFQPFQQQQQQEQPQQQQQPRQQQQFQPFQQQQPQQQPGADFDTMFNALSNPFAAPSAGNAAFGSSMTFGSLGQQPIQQRDLSSTPFGVYQSTSSIGFSSSNVAVNQFSGLSAGQQDGGYSGNNVVPATVPAVPAAGVSVNNPFRQSMYPTQQQQQQQPQSQQQDLSLVNQMAQMDIQQSYNPFTQRQTMYLDSMGTTPFGQQQQLQMHQPQPQQQLQQTQPQQLQQFGSGGGGIANITSPFAGANANSTQTGNNAGQFLASPFGTSQPQQQQLQQHQQQQTSVHALQNTLNNGNFADFNFFQ